MGINEFEESKLIFCDKLDFERKEIDVEKELSKINDDLKDEEIDEFSKKKIQEYRDNVERYKYKLRNNILTNEEKIDLLLNINLTLDFMYQTIYPEELETCKKCDKIVEECECNH